MNKNKFFTAVITLGLSVIILFVISYFTFNKNKINQGNFRISDAILSSIVELEDKSEGTTDWKYDVSQNNKISMLVQKVGDAAVEEVYLKNLKVKTRNDVHIYIEQDKYEIRHKYEQINNRVNIYAEETESGDYLVEFDIKNEDVITDFKIPSDIKEIRHDGTILNTVGIPVSQIDFKLKYELVIVQDNQRINSCKVEIDMPSGRIITDGFVVERLDSTNYNFKVGY